jgi:hypothetical protein
MKKLNKEMTLFASQMHSRKVRTLVMVLTVALFVLGAAAPSASTGIGK